MTTQFGSLEDVEGLPDLGENGPSPARRKRRAAEEKTPEQSPPEPDETEKTELVEISAALHEAAVGEAERRGCSLRALVELALRGKVLPGDKNGVCSACGNRSADGHAYNCQYAR